MLFFLGLIFPFAHGCCIFSGMKAFTRTCALSLILVLCSCSTQDLAHRESSPASDGALIVPDDDAGAPDASQPDSDAEPSDGPAADDAAIADQGNPSPEAGAELPLAGDAGAGGDLAQDAALEDASPTDISEDRGALDGATADGAGGELPYYGGRDDAGNCRIPVLKDIRRSSEILISDTIDESLQGPCDAIGIPFAGPAGAKVRVELASGNAFDSFLELYDTFAMTGRKSGSLATSNGGSIAPARIDFTLPYSGRYLAVVRSTNEHFGRFALSVYCSDGCDKLFTRYPIALVHGFMGFKSIGPIEYFYQVSDTLTAQGYQVYTPQTDAFNSIAVRSKQLVVELQKILDDSGAEKVDLIAHSQGGLDSRNAITNLGMADHIAALCTFATPHKGTAVADAATGLLGPVSQEAVSMLLNIMGVALGGSNEMNAKASFHDMTRKFVTEEFNPATPDDPRVDYFSYNGHTSLDGSNGDFCQVQILVGYEILLQNEGDNDGIVGVESSKYADYRGIVPADHFDEIGQVAGVIGPNYNQKTFFAKLAHELFTRGH